MNFIFLLKIYTLHLVERVVVQKILREKIVDKLKIGTPVLSVAKLFKIDAMACLLFSMFKIFSQVGF